MSVSLRCSDISQVRLSLHGVVRPPRRCVLSLMVQDEEKVRTLGQVRGLFVCKGPFEAIPDHSAALQ